MADSLDHFTIERSTVYFTATAAFTVPNDTVTPVTIPLNFHGGTVSVGATLIADYPPSSLATLTVQSVIAGVSVTCLWQHGIADVPAGTVIPSGANVYPASAFSALLGSPQSATLPYQFDDTTLPNPIFFYKLTGYTANGVVIPYNVVSIRGATAGTLEWALDMTAHGALTPQAIVVDHANTVIAVGVFNKSILTNLVNFGGGDFSCAGIGDSFLVRYAGSNPSPTVTIFVGVGSQMNPWSVAADSQNNVLVAGYFSGTIDFSATGQVGATLTAVGFQDAFVVKYSSSGSVVWVKQYGAVGNHYGTAVAVDGSDNVFAAVRFDTATDFGTGLKSPDIALIKLSGNDGSTLWAQSWSSGGFDTLKGIAVDSSGNVTITGSAAGVIDLGGGNTPSGGIFIAQYLGSNGNWRWNHILGSGSGNAITADPTTKYIFVTGQGANGFFLNAYDSSGTLLWSYVNGASGDGGLAVATDGAGNISITGQSSSALNFGTGWMFGGGWFIADFSITGTSPPDFRWAKRANGQSWGFGLAYDSLGHVLVTGQFNSGSSIDFGGVVLTPQGGQDGFLAQYDK